MNEYKTIQTEYLRASRTIETVLVSNKNLSDLFFIYNYEGVSFRLFKNYIDLVNFFLNKSESNYHFDSEDAVDDFLTEVKLAA
ncbi:MULTISPECIES: hypothetical protein [Winogradskyella]|uniref:hypothetical protein n=1 Tax=Winogradskyella TaxID=286104 RepID=UPI0015CE88B6|nr:MULTISPECIES: hypothetical protein [Winogradskyella]QXP80187.1 hypothetical protein H0I32_06050 [Winogradskyella sp. HaHa_3_26]